MFKFMNGSLLRALMLLACLASATAHAAPATPSGVSASATSSQIQVTWTASAGAVFYSVRRATASNGPWSNVAAAQESKYVDTFATAGTRYYYVVAAVGRSGESANSAPVSAQLSGTTPPTTGRPATPTNLAATAGTNLITVTWKASSGAKSYTVRRATASSGPWTNVASVQKIKFVDRAITTGTTYYYVVAAVGSGGESANTAPVVVSTGSTPTPLVPAAPQNLVATAGDKSVSLVWAASGTATGYRVKRATSSGGSYTQVAAPTATSYADTAVTNGVTYYYVVTASNATGESANSAQAAATPQAPVTPPTTGGSLVIQVSGNHFVDGAGSTVQLRGVNVSGIEFAYVQHQSTTNPWAGATGTATPNWSLIRNTWKANVVRIPLNESSWFGTSCTLSGNASYDPDPGNNYKAVVIQSVNNATAAGLYVIVDLHWNAPDMFCANQQNAMATSKSITWWTDVANTFKSYPNVLFELFNEPFPEESSFGGSNDGTAAWAGLLNGLTLTKFSQSGYGDTSHTWNTVGMQALLNAVRNTGATNVVLAGGLDWSQNLSQWLAYKPVDPLNQLGAVWHAYGYKAYEGNANQKGKVAGIVSAGYPVVITEFGESNKSSSFSSNLLPWADGIGVSYLGWSFNPWEQYGSTENVLIVDAAGNPTSGFGTYVKNHYICRAAGTTTCP